MEPVTGIYNIETKYKKIFHISDIHIRLYQRMDEYNYVFNKLFGFLEKHKIEYPDENNLIICTGDLLHMKTELSPECIVTTIKFLTKLSSIYPFILIPGNHDALLNNNQRLDSISAILHGLEIPNLYYFPKTGVNQFGNLLVTCNSLLDGKFIKAKRLNYFNNITKISLYHGGVGETETDVGYRLKGDKLISDFDGYDLVLLGDIHKFQYLRSDKTMAYSSSLICQGFGETDIHHGILVWNIEDKSSYYHIIDNPWAYRNLYYINDKIMLKDNDQNTISDTIESINTNLIETNYLPKYGHLKIISINSNPIKTKTLSQIINKILKDIKIVIHEKTFKGSTIKNIVNINEPIQLSNNDFTDPNIMWKHIISTFWKNKKMTMDMIQGEMIINKFIEMTASRNIKPPIENNLSQFHWKLMYLRFNNLFGYGQNNLIVWDSYPQNSLIGLFANNSMGKSTLIDILTFMLFGKIARYQVMGNCKDLININYQNADADIVFMLGDSYYMIRKKLKREKSDKIKILDEVLYTWKVNSYPITEYPVNEYIFSIPNLITNLTDEHRLKTDKLIVDLIGTYDEFIFTSISLQNRDKSIKDMTQKERKEFLSKILKLNIFPQDWIDQINDLYKKTKFIKEQTINKLSLICGDKCTSNSTNIINKFKLKITEISNKITELLIDKDVLDKTIVKLNDTKDDLLKKMISIDQIIKINNLVNIVPKNGTIDMINVLIKQYNESLIILKDEQLNLNKKINNLNETFYELTNIKDDNYKKLDLKYKLTDNIQNNLLFINNELNTINEIIRDDTIKLNEINVLITNKKNKLSEYQTFITKCKSLDENLISNNYLHETNLTDIDIDELLNYKQSNNIKQFIDNYELYKNDYQKYSELIKLNIVISKYKFNHNCEDCKHNCLLQNYTVEQYNQFIQLSKNEYVVNFNNYNQFITKLNIIFNQLKLINENEKIVSSEISDLENEKNKVTNIINNNNNKIILLKDDIKEKNNKLSKIKNEIKEIAEQNCNLDLEIKKITSEQDKIKDSNLILNKILEYEKLICGLQNSIKMIDKYNNDSDILIKLNKSLSSKLDELKIINDNIIVYENECNKINNELSTYMGLLDQLKTAENDIIIYQNILYLIGREGISLYLLTEYLPVISNRINEIIIPFAQRRIDLQCIDDEIILQSYPINEDINKSVQMYGGMESFIIDLSFKIVLSQLAILPKGDILIIDEGISALDSNHIENLESLLNFTKNYFNKILLISHLQSIRDHVDYTLDIKKNGVGQCSYINNYKKTIINDIKNKNNNNIFITL
jgi:DNA repair exonuclease SbcCD ATPase subunit